MEDRASRFIQAFTTIENELRSRVERYENDPKHLAFPTLVDRSKDLTDRQRELLKSHGDLRNAIVHNPRDIDEEIIADPRESAVRWLEKQADIIVDPPLVMGVLNLSKPTVLHAEDDLGAFLKIVEEKRFSQVPIVDDDGALGLITTNIVTRWLAHEYMDDGSAIVESVKLREIHQFAEDTDSLRLAPRNLKAVEAVQIFAGMWGQVSPAAIVITEHGKNHQTPLGLLSKSDVVSLLHALDV